MKRILIASFIASGAVPTVLYAASDNNANVMEEVVVTARKREESAQAVPIPITALTGAQLETRNIRDITEVERLSPNTSISGSSVNNSATVVFIRGIGQVNWSETQDPKIGIYVDGVYLSRPQGGLVDLMDVQRVEVLRGPQGTLFGRNTTAGLIHMVTNAPGPDQQFDIQAGIGDNGHQTYGFTYNQPITENLAARFALYSKETDGFIINSLTGNDRGNEDALSYRGSLALNLENYTVRFTYDHFEADERAPLGSCRFVGDPNVGAGLNFVSQIFGIYDDIQTNCQSTTRDVSIDTTNNEGTSSDVDAFILNQSYDFGSVAITSVTSYREIEAFNGSWGWVMGNGPGSNFLEILNNDSNNEIFSQELRLSGGTDRLDWVVGAYVFKEDSFGTLDVPLFRGVGIPSCADAPLFCAPDGAGGTLGLIALGTQAFGGRNSTNVVTNKNRAIFAEATYGVTDRLDLTLGARYTKDDREFRRFQTLVDVNFVKSFDPGYFCPGMQADPVTGLPTSDNCFQEVSYDEVTPRAILGYQLNNDVLLYGSYSVGYSSGGFNQDTRMRAFLPETSDNWEFGAKSSLFDNRLRLNGTVFHNIYKNQQLTVGRLVDGQPTADLINAQEATLQGVEFEILASITDSLSIAAAGGYLSGNYDEFLVDDNTTGPNLETIIVSRDLSDIEFGNDGDEISFDISLLHQASFSFGGLTSSIGVSYKDEQYYSLLNTPSSQVDSYWLVDGRVTWLLTNDATSISIWGTNLTDKEYVTSILDQAGDIQIGGTDASLGMAADYWGDPRRIGVEVRHSY